MALGGTTGQNPTMVPDGNIVYSHQAIPHTLKSPVLFLFIVPTSFCFFFLHFFTIYLLLLVVPGISECLGCLRMLFIMVQGKSHPGHGLPPSGLCQALLVVISGKVPVQAPWH